MNIKDEITLLFNSELTKKSVKVLLIRIIGIAFFFGLTLLITNTYSLYLVGRYDFSRSFLLLFGTISVLGMNQSIIYYSGYLKSIKALEELKFIYLKMLSIIFIISILLSLIIFSFKNILLDDFFNKNVGVLIKKSITCVLFYSVTILNIETYRAINKIYISELVRNFFRYILFLFMVILLSFYKKEEYLIDAFLINFVIIGCLSTAFILYRFRKNSTTKKGLFNHKQIIRRSAPMSISLVTLVLMQSVDVILLSKYTSFEDVAAYAVTVKLTIIITLALTSVNTVFAPKMAELYSLESFKKLEREIIKATRLITLLTIPVIIVMFLFSGFILEMFGKDYLIAKKALYILLVGQTVNALCGAVGVYMNMTNKQNILQIFLILAFIVNLILNLLLIPKFGIEGAAIATTISMILWNVLGSLYIYKKDKIKTFLN